MTTEYTDDNGAVSIYMDEAQVVAVTVRPTWTNYYETAQLVETLNTLLTKATPPTPQRESVPTLAPELAVPMTLERTAQFWNEFSSYQELRAKRVARISTEPANAPTRTEESDEQRHVKAVWVNGRFQSKTFNFEWACRSNAQTIGRILTEVLSTHPLIASPPKDSEWEKMQVCRATMNAIRAGK